LRNNPNANENVCWYLDTNRDKVKNVLIPFWFTQGNKSHTNFWCDDESLYDYSQSFFKFNNCMSLLRELLINFGLVWKINYIVNKQQIWKWDIKFNFSSRFFNNDRSDLVTKIYNDIQGKPLPLSNGLLVSIVKGKNISNILISSTRNEKTLWRTVPHREGMKKTTTFFKSYQPADRCKRNLEMKQCLFGHKEDNIVAPLDSYTVFRNNEIHVTHPLNRLSVNYDKNATITKEEAETCQSYFAEMLANYYEGPFGIISNIKNVLTFTVGTIDIEPLDFMLIKDKKYIITEVEKDFIQGNSKLVLKEY
jgi:hypothetical protein